MLLSHGTCGAARAAGHTAKADGLWLTLLARPLARPASDDSRLTCIGPIDWRAGKLRRRLKITNVPRLGVAGRTRAAHAHHTTQRHVGPIGAVCGRETARWPAR